MLPYCLKLKKSEIKNPWLANINKGRTMILSKCDVT